MQGDAWGDMFFDLRSAAFALECAADAPRSYNNDCINAEVNNRSNLVITKLILEVMMPYGRYAMCNVCSNGVSVAKHHR